MRYDAEMPAVIYAVFRELAIGAFTIQLNNRKLLRGYFEGARHRRRRAAGAGAARSGQARQARRASRARQRWPARVSGSPPTPSTKLMDFVAGALDAAMPMRWRKLDALGARQRTLFEEGRARAARSAAALISAMGVPEYALRAQPVDRARPGLLHRHRLRDHARRLSADRLDLLGRPLRRPRRPLHEVEAARRRHFDRPDAAVLPAARSRHRASRRKHGRGAGGADGRRRASTTRWRCRSELRGAGINTEAQLEAAQARASSCNTPTAPASASS